MLDTLFKRTATGAIQVWEIETEAQRGRYRFISGKLGGKMVASEWTQAKPKNTGRANATTAEEQAMLEVKAHWEKKRRDGYSLTIEGAAGSERFQCMLADTYVDFTNPKKSRKPAVLRALAANKAVYSQPKLDGVRMIASKDSMLSRKGRPIVAVPHIFEALIEVFEACPDIRFDGELYAHSLCGDFNEILSMVRKENLTSEEIDACRAVVQYHIYDIWTPDDHDFSDRKVMLEHIFGGSMQQYECLQLVPSKRVFTEAGIEAAYVEYLEQGYEGQVLRIDGPYEQKRSALLIKRKEHEDKEFKVLSIEEGEGNRTGQAGCVWVQLEDDARCKAGIKGPQRLRVDLLRNAPNYVGGDVTVRFNGRTPDKMLRFPRAIAWYPDGRDL